MLSRRLLAAYTFDWIIIIVIALIGFGFYKITPNYHAFSVLDLSISYPLFSDTVSVAVAGLVSVILPAAVIFLVTLLLVPGPQTVKLFSWGDIIRIKLWEWNTGWMGLALSVASAFMVSQGLKNFGKPRPNMLARCDPNLDTIGRHNIGGYGTDISSRWILVDQTICRQTNKSILNDGFQSWPSGHATIAFAGLVYFTLYLCAKFAVAIPFFPQSFVEAKRRSTEQMLCGRRASSETARPILRYEAGHDKETSMSISRTAAAPPTWLLFLILIPLGGAFYIAGSRYFDYAHHGFDILSGAVIGTITSWFSFRWYHLPVRKGSGWSWGARSPSRAFGIGVGLRGYTEATGQCKGRREEDLEMGPLPSAARQGLASDRTG